MAVQDKLLLGLNRLIGKAGKIISIQYFKQTTGSIYDEPDALTQSGNTVWTSGIIFPLDPNNSEDLILLEQGKEGEKDLRLYTIGSLMLSFTTGSVVQTVINIGSPNGAPYTLIPRGGVPWEVNNTEIYKKAYIRSLPGGSLIGM